jgi:hypothetical protein
MRDTLIPNREWLRFFERFSYGHRGWPVTVFVVDTAMLENGTAGDAVDCLVEDQPLEGITAVDRGDDREVVIITDDGRAQTSRTVVQPTALIVVHAINGTETALRIDSAGGSSTILSFPVMTQPQVREASLFDGQ